MIHYKPQDHISIYEPLMQKNYSLAQKWYLQKRIMFENQFQNDIGFKVTKITDALNLTIQEEWKKKIELLTQSLISKPIIKNGQHKGYSYSISSLYTPGDPDVDAIVKYIQQRPGLASNPKAEMGKRFENFISTKIFNNKNLDFAMESVIENGLSSVIFELTGKKQSTSALVKGTKQIRPDAFISFGADIQMTDENGQLMMNSNNQLLSVELQNKIDLNVLDENTLINIMKNYLEANAYGFSLKYWSGGSGKTFTRSSKLKSDLNSVFRQKLDGTYHSWEEEYATAYANWEVSKYLINLINPNVIALISGNGFEWMDTFLESHILRMRVQRAATTNKHKKLPFNSYRNGEPSTETLPLIKNDDIYIQTVSSLRKMQIRQQNRAGGHIKVKNALALTPV